MRMNRMIELVVFPTVLFVVTIELYQIMLTKDLIDRVQFQYGRDDHSTNGEEGKQTTHEQRQSVELDRLMCVISHHQWFNWSQIVVTALLPTLTSLSYRIQASPKVPIQTMRSVTML